MDIVFVEGSYSKNIEMAWFNLFYPTPMMTNELGMGMVLHSNPCASISVESTTMAGLNMSNVVAPNMCSFSPMDLPKGMVQNEHSAIVLVEADKAFETGVFLVDQDPGQANETLKNEITSKDTMVHNLTHPDVETSSFEGHSISFMDNNFGLLLFCNPNLLVLNLLLMLRVETKSLLD
ncbi:hypothetical protein Ancab_029181 [Ancistrocladus abbreviatus]